MARSAAALFAIAVLSGCTVFGGAGTASIRAARVEAQGVGGKAGVGADGAFARGGSRQVTVQPTE